MDFEPSSIVCQFGIWYNVLEGDDNIVCCCNLIAQTIDLSSSERKRGRNLLPAIFGDYN